MLNDIRILIAAHIILRKMDAKLWQFAHEAEGAVAVKASATERDDLLAFRSHQLYEYVLTLTGDEPLAHKYATGLHRKATITIEHRRAAVRRKLARGKMRAILAS